MTATSQAVDSQPAQANPLPDLILSYLKTDGAWGFSALQRQLCQTRTAMAAAARALEALQLVTWERGTIALMTPFKRVPAACMLDPERFLRLHSINPRPPRTSALR
jgi:hypothetical protein